MSEQEDWKGQARRRLIKDTLAEIDITKAPHEAYLDALYVANLGLLKKAQKEGLFDKETWQTKETLTQQITSIESFLWKEIK